MTVPTAILMTNNVEIRSRLRRHSLTFRRSTTSPMPALMQSPATQEPKAIPPFRNVCVRMTDEAQLGMSPTSVVIRGCRKIFAERKFSTFSSPIK